MIVTKFSGEIVLDNKLSDKEYDFYARWSLTRNCIRDDFSNGCYFAAENILHSNLSNHNAKNIIQDVPPEGQPNSWCQWVVGDDKKTIHLDSAELFESFYNVFVESKWIAYISEHFFNNNPMAKRLYPENFEFLNGNRLNGELFATDTDASDKAYKINIINSKVYLSKGEVTADTDILIFNDWSDPKEILYEPSFREQKMLEKLSLEDAICKNNRIKKIKNKI